MQSSEHAISDHMSGKVQRVSSFARDKDDIRQLRHEQISDNLELNRVDHLRLLKVVLTNA